MYEPSMTLPERERLHYITNSPVHRAVVGLLDAENDALDEMRHERDMAKEDNTRLNRENEDLQTALEAAEEKVLTLTSELESAQDEIKALQAQIHEAGIDLA